MSQRNATPEEVIAHILMFKWKTYSEKYDEYAFTAGGEPILSARDVPKAHLIFGDKAEGWYQEEEIRETYRERTGSTLNRQYFANLEDQGIIERSRRQYTDGRRKKIRHKNICRLRTTLEAYEFCGQFMLDRGLFHEFVDSTYYRRLPPEVRNHYPRRLVEKLFPEWQVHWELFGADHPATRSDAETLLLWAPELMDMAVRDKHHGTDLLGGWAKELKEVFSRALPDMEDSKHYDGKLSLIFGILQAGNVIRAHIQEYQTDPDSAVTHRDYWAHEAFETAWKEITNPLMTHYIWKHWDDIHQVVPKEETAHIRKRLSEQHKRKLLELSSTKTDQGGGTKGASKRRKKAAN